MASLFQSPSQSGPLPSFFVLLFIFLFPFPVSAGHESFTADMKFSDPQKTLVMPDAWRQQPIRYEKWAEGADLAVTLDQGLYSYIYDIVMRYGAEKGLKIAIQEGTCGISAGKLGSKAVDISAFCCPPGQEDRLPGLSYHTVGIEAIAFIVHPDNPVAHITAQQLADIYRGRIFSWGDLQVIGDAAVSKRQIKTIGRLHCRKRPGHWRLLLNKDSLFSPRLLEVGSIPDMIRKVADSKEAIGWEVLSMVDHYHDMGQVKPLVIDGFSPDNPAALAQGRYPYYRVYNMTTWQADSGAKQIAADLVAYVLREIEKADTAKFGFVTIQKLKEAGWKMKGDELVGEADWGARK